MKNKLASWITLSRNIYRDNWRFVWCTIGVCFGVFLIRPLITPIFLQQLFNEIETGTSKSLLILGFVALVALGILTMFSYILIVFSDAWFNHLTNYGNIHAFRSLFTIPFYKIEQQYSSEEQLNRISNGCSGSTSIFALLTQCVTYLICSVIVLILLVRISPAFLIYAIVLMVIEIIRASIEGKANYKFQSQIEIQSASTHGALFSLITNIEELSISSSQGYYLKQYNQFRQAVWKEQKKKAFLKAILDAVSETALLATMFGLYHQLFRLVQIGKASVGDVAAGQRLFEAFISNFSSARMNLMEVPKAFTTIDRLEEILDGAKLDITDEAKPIEDNNPFAINIKNLCIEGNDKTLFSNLNLSIKHGEKVAIIGPNGCGKSTLLKAILGEYTIKTGSISLAGKEISEITPEEKRTLIGYCPPTFQLYNISGFKNIEMGSFQEQVPLPQNQESAEEREKYIKSVPENMSEGQKQRVAIYRCLAGKTPIVIADEPDSALDLEQANVFVDCLIDNSNTLIAVTHNPAMLSKFSRIINLKDLL